MNSFNNDFEEMEKGMKRYFISMIAIYLGSIIVSIASIAGLIWFCFWLWQHYVK